MEVRIKKLHSDSQFSAWSCGNGMDLFAYLDSPVLLNPGMRRLVPTGIAVNLPLGTEAQVRPKRCLAINFGITILDTPQIIAEDDASEIHILLVNLGEKGFSVKSGMAIAQLAIVPVYQPQFSLIDETGVVAYEEMAATCKEPLHAPAGFKMEALSLG